MYPNHSVAMEQNNHQCQSAILHGGRAMILAAGKGTRLRPLTDSLPKALVKVGGEPLIQRQMQRLQFFGFTDITVNVHHFASMLCSYLERNTPAGLKIHISHEEAQLLNTGGALKHARPLLLQPQSGKVTTTYELPVLVHNVDILSNAPLDDFFAKACGHDATLLVSNRESSRQLYFHPQTMRLVGWQNMLSGETRSPLPDFKPSELRWKRYAFSGIHAIGPRALKAMDDWPDTGFSIIDFYLQECLRLDICGIARQSLKLLDVGKLETLARADKFQKEIEKEQGE